MKKHHLLILSFIFTLGIISCGSQESKHAGFDERVEIENLEVEVEEATETINRKLIKEGSLAFEVESVPNRKEIIYKAIKKNKGFISKENEYSSSTRLNSRITIRVPASNFDQLVKDVSAGEDNFDRKDINLKDVTDEYVDISARVKTKKELENRYLDLLKKAKTVEEILTIEKSIANLRGEIESIEGRLRLLKNQVSLSTLHVDIYESVPTSHKFASQFKDGFVNGWNNLIYFFVGLVNVWPFLILIPLIIFFILRWKKKQRNKH